jgi:hypothetical protein
MLTFRLVGEWLYYVFKRLLIPFFITPRYSNLKTDKDNFLKNLLLRPKPFLTIPSCLLESNFYGLEKPLKAIPTF